MAYITKLKAGYRAQLYVKGMRESQTFPTKREASVWAAKRESELEELSKKSPSQKHTLAELLQLYSAEVSEHKRGVRWEQIRLAKYLRDPDLPLTKTLADITADDFIAWKNCQAKLVKSSTIIRDLNLLSACFSHAKVELRWLSENPLKEVRRPEEPAHRDVVISASQVKSMLKVMGYSPARSPVEVRQVVAVCFLLALRTGMRAGELCKLTWGNVRKNSCLLPTTKTRPREVALSARAMRVLEKMRGYDEDLVFGLKTSTLDAMFRKYRERAGLSGFTFHDSRHTAATMIARYIDVLDLCKMFGWTDPKMAMIYYNPTATDIANRLNVKRPKGN